MPLEDLQALVKHARKRPLWEAGATTREMQVGRADIERMLPHRDPFLFVDGITAVDREQGGMRGRRSISPEDPVFQGHFPGRPIYPGVLQIETMGQLGVCLAHVWRNAHAPTDVRALKVHHAVFQDVVLPGDELTILARLLEANDYTAICAGQLLKPDGSVPAVAVMEVYFVD